MRRAAADERLRVVDGVFDAGDAFIARVWEEATEAVLNERTRTNATQTNGTEPSAGETNGANATASTGPAAAATARGAAVAAVAAAATAAVVFVPRGLRRRRLGRI